MDTHHVCISTVVKINVACCIGFVSACSVQMYENYSQWYWHSSGSDWLSRATYDSTGNTELVMVNISVSWLIKKNLQKVAETQGLDSWTKISYYFTVSKRVEVQVRPNVEHHC